MSERVSPDVWRKPLHFVACGFGAGAAKIAPGTFGTVVAIPLYLSMQGLALEYYLLVAALAFLFGVWLCGVVSRDIGVEDHPGIVWDEIVGYILTMTAAPEGWLWIIIGFFLFRFFDILKPWPIRVADRRVGGGFGIMLDDVLAAVYAWLILQAIVIGGGIFSH